MLAKSLYFIIPAIWLVSIPLACLPGPMAVPPGQVMDILLGMVGLVDASHLDPATAMVVGQIRFSRVILALLVGGGLAVAGTALQGVLRNPLADPFVLGISAGAACGASLAIVFGAKSTGGSGTMIASSAFAGAMAALSLSLVLGRAAGGLKRETVILSGIAVATFLGAVVSMVKALNEESVASIVFWIMGSFQGRGWADAPLIVWPLVIGLAAVILYWRELDILHLGDLEAAQLGLDVGRARFWTLAGASCITAGCVAVAGVIGFVGLIVPHILRIFLGAAHGPLLFCSWFGGGILLLWADALARSILPNGLELPVGVVTSLIGGPFFAMIISRRSKTQ